MFVSALPCRTLIYLLNFLFVKPSSQICNQILHLRVPNLGDQQLRLVAVGTLQTGRNISKCCRALMGPAVNLTMTLEDALLGEPHSDDRAREHGQARGY